MALRNEIPRIGEALELARAGEAERIAEAVQTGRVVGVLGEAEVGKSETIRQALGPSDRRLSVVRLDLDAGAASESHTAFLLVKQIAEAYLGQENFAALRGGLLIPAAREAQRIALAEILGVDGLDEALRDWPSGRYSLAQALAILERLASQRETILWIDHLESPALTPRHPLDLDRLLWAVRESLQRVPRLTVVLSGREAIEPQLLGSDAAFHQQGQWLTIDNPPVGAWHEVGTGLGLRREAVAELATLTRGHPVAMILALLELLEGGPARGAFEAMYDLVALHAGLAGRSMQHARTLHRLGGQVMTQVALGQGPYAAAQRGETSPQEIRKVLGRLRLAGLLRHDDGWSIVNPLVGIALQGDVPMLLTPTVPDWEIDRRDGED